MWMVDCEDQHVKDVKVSMGRTMRPLMLRSITTAAATTATTNCTYSTLPSPYCCTNNPNVIGWSQPISCESDYGVKREITRVPLVSPRWNPTPEQLQALEELYRRGIRTPSAQHIQHIAAKLRRFGKIEGKNVFYWFQNHKARERQKKRRQLELHAGKKSHHADAIFETKLQMGCSRENIELENVKMQSSTFSNSSTPSQESVSLHTAVVATEWTKLYQRELQQQAKSEHTCWQLDLSSCLPSNNSYNITKQNIVPENNPGQENEKPLNISLLILPAAPKDDDEIMICHDDSGIQENRTLLLFPIKSHGSSTLHSAQEEVHCASSMGMACSPIEFYEFLPTKN